VRTIWLGILLGILAAGCSRRAPPTSSTASATGDASPASVQATHTTQTSSAPAVLALPFVEDDYARALADARAKHRPIFVDAWAIWCHTCLSLKSFVLTDPALSEHKEAFTWLTVDSEKAENADLVERLGLRVLPTLWVLDPITEKPVWSWNGGLTATELTTALRDVRARAQTTARDKDLAAAQTDAANGRAEGALAHYRAALDDRAPFPERARAVDAFVSLLEDREAKESKSECVAVARREGPSLPEGTYRVDVAVIGVRCAIDAKDDAALESLASELGTLTTSAAPTVLADDRSSAFEALVDAQKALGDKEGAKSTAARWAAFLEREAGHARTPAERVVFDAHRLGAYIELGDAARALPMLDASERDFPDDYNPSARKCRAFFELARFDEALAACDRALAKAYGPRRLRIHVLRADVYAKRNDRAGERAALEAALVDAKKLSLRPSYDRLRKSIEERLRRLPPP
jgi:hypothetical protein